MVVAPARKTDALSFQICFSAPLVPFSSPTGDDLIIQSTIYED